MATEPTTGPINGSGGNASFDSEVTDVRNWRINRTNDIKEYVSSDTGGYTKNLKGNYRADGSFDFYLDQGAQAIGFEVGELGDLVLTSADGKTFTAEARIANIEVGVDIEGNELEGCTVSFNINGEWSVV